MTSVSDRRNPCFEALETLVEVQAPADVEDLINNLLRRDPAEDLRAIRG